MIIVRALAVFLLIMGILAVFALDHSELQENVTESVRHFWQGLFTLIQAILPSILVLCAVIYGLRCLFGRR